MTTPPEPSTPTGLADLLGVGVAAVDLEGRQTYVNPAFARMVGWPVEALIGASPPFVYWPPEEADRIAQAMHRTLAGDAPPPGFELRFRRADETRFDVLISIAPLRAGGAVLGWVASATDISKQKAAEQGLLDREQRLELAMSAGRLGSWEYHIATGRVLWSSTLERIHGIEPGTFGGTFDDYTRDIHPDDVDRVLATIAQSSHGDIPHRLEYRIIRPSGEVRWLEASGQLFEDAQGLPSRMLGVCADVTDRKAAEELAGQARDEAERANRAKAEFLAAMSHELRTPLNAIGGYLDLLELGIHGPLTASQRTVFASIKRNQDHLLVLINDVLNFAQLAAGRLKYDLRSVGASEFLERSRPLLEPHAAARGVALLVDAVAEDVVMRVDQDRLQQIMLNVVGNAAKFTPAGGHIRVWCDTDGGHVRIHVSDTGRGIPQDKLESVFDPFTQVERTRDGDGDKGVGLGLTISRDLARAMQGDLTVVSEIGRGSTFSITTMRG